MPLHKGSSRPTGLSHMADFKMSIPFSMINSESQSQSCQREVSYHESTFFSIKGQANTPTSVSQTLAAVLYGTKAS